MNDVLESTWGPVGPRLFRLLAPLLLLGVVGSFGVPSARRLRALQVGPESAGGRQTESGAPGSAEAAGDGDDGLPEDWEDAMWPALPFPDLELTPAPGQVTAPPRGSEWVEFPAGSFLVGDESLPGAGPTRSVAIPAFELQRTEFSWRQLAPLCAAAGDGPGSLPGDLCDRVRDADPTWPVVGATRDEAAAACASLGARLPSEAEWERAARGTSGRRHPWGDRFESWRANTVLRMTGRLLHSKAEWHAFVQRAKAEGRTPTPAPVGASPGDVTPEGALDLHGNVMEWVAGAWSPAPGSTSTGADGTTLPAASDRLGVVRGVSVVSRDYAAPAAARFPLPLEWRADNIGWRCARSLERGGERAALPSRP